MKHKKFTMIVALVLVVALAAGLGIWATGEEKLPTVTYYDGNDGNNARFAFTNTGKGRRRTCLPTSPTACPATASRRPSALRPTAPTARRARRSTSAPRSTATPPPRRAPPSSTTMCSAIST